MLDGQFRHRTHDLTVFGPPGTRARLEALVVDQALLIVLRVAVTARMLGRSSGAAIDASPAAAGHHD